MQGTCPKNRCRNCSPSSRKWCALWAFKKDFPARRMPSTSFCNSLHPFARSGAGLPVSTFLFSLPRQYVVGPADWRNYILWPLCAVEFWRWPWKQTLMFLLSVRRGFQILMPSFNSTMFCFVFSTWQGLSAYSRSNWQLLNHLPCSSLDVVKASRSKCWWRQPGAGSSTKRRSTIDAAAKQVSMFHTQRVHSHLLKLEERLEECWNEEDLQFLEFALCVWPDRVMTNHVHGKLQRGIASNPPVSLLTGRMPSISLELFPVHLIIYLAGLIGRRLL